MHKRHRSVALTPELIQVVEKRRTVFSFSAYLEYLAWKGIRSLEKQQEEEMFVKALNRLR